MQKNLPARHSNNTKHDHTSRSRAVIELAGQPLQLSTKLTMDHYAQMSNTAYMVLFPSRATYALSYH
jgi:hypothetical protein